MKGMVYAVAASVLLASAGVQAEVSEADFAQFKAQLKAMQSRVEALESENRALRASSRGAVQVEDLEATNSEVAALKKNLASPTADAKIKVKGDFRYRFEDIEEQGKEDRDRYRIRARAAVAAKPSETTEVGLGIASGSGDPVSTNQTLGGGGTSKELNIDLAYFTWTGLEDTAVTAGKFSNPFYQAQKSGLIWDGDYRPEGVALGWSNDILFVNALYSFLESDRKNNDVAMWGAQVGSEFAVSDGVKLTASAMYLTIPTRNHGPFYDGSFFGNSADQKNGNAAYAYDYNLINASVELGFSLADLPFSLYADIVRNNDANDLENGYLAGAQLGKAKNKGTWQVQYQYQVLEADATFGLMTDSDFAGGGTDGEGHKLSAQYAIDNHWYVGATYFDTDRGVDLGNDAHYQRFQLDTGLKY